MSPIRLAVCWRCRMVLVDGDGPAVEGECIVCADWRQKVQRQEELAAARKKRRRPAMTQEQRESLDPEVVFAGLTGGDTDE